MDRLPKFILLFPLLYLKPRNAYAKEQSYLTILRNMTECPAPDLPYAIYSPFDIKFEKYNGTHANNLLRGNLTIKEYINQEDKKASFKCGIQGTDGLKWRFSTKDLGCKSIVVKAVFGAFGIPFVNKCGIKKGTYYLSNINVGKVQRAFLIPTRMFGNWLCVFAIYNPEYTLGCWNVYLRVMPVKA